VRHCSQFAVAERQKAVQQPQYFEDLMECTCGAFTQLLTDTRPSEAQLKSMMLLVFRIVLKCLGLDQLYRVLDADTLPINNRDVYVVGSCLTDDNHALKGHADIWIVDHENMVHLVFELKSLRKGFRSENFLQLLGSVTGATLHNMNVGFRFPTDC
jgi:hypothetical protein